MVVMIESLIGILLFTILIVPLTLKNPLISVEDYPSAIREKCNLGQRIWKNTGIIVFISGSPALAWLLGCLPVLW